MKLKLWICMMLLCPVLAMANAELPQPGAQVWSHKHQKYCKVVGTYELGDGKVAGLILEVVPTNPWKSNYQDTCPLGQFIN